MFKVLNDSSRKCALLSYLSSDNGVETAKDTCGISTLELWLYLDVFQELEVFFSECENIRNCDKIH